MDKQISIFTIGHSTNTIEKFLSIIKHYNITEIVDIRTIPKSKYNPQFFNGQELAKVLRNHHIGYRHEKKLGGLRYPNSHSINKAWRNTSFRGFADYMQTAEFLECLNKIIELAHRKVIALMCAEAVLWRCHRSLIGDALLANNIVVYDIFSITNIKLYTLTRWAVVKDHNVIYA